MTSAFLTRTRRSAIAAVCTLTAVWASPAAHAQPCDGVEYDGICFPQGDASFADEVIRYVPMFSGGTPPSDPDAADPTSALGPPDYDGTSATFVSLAQGGLIQFALTDVLLANSGDGETELHVFEVDAELEIVEVALRPTAATEALLADAGILPGVDDWYHVGTADGATASIDIDAFFPGFGAGDLVFDGVQLMDDPTSGGGEGATPGADIDAVGVGYAGPGGETVTGCCEVHSTPGCHTVECQEDVCASDPYCCEQEWDGVCVDEACATASCACPAEACPGIGDGPGEGDCCAPNGSPGCAIEACQATVCAGDPYCCSTEWDAFCVGDACLELACGCPEEACAPGPGGDCCTTGESPGCSEPDCESQVCAGDPYCCNTQWDELCASDACGLAVCNCPGENCASDHTPGGGGTPPDDNDPPAGSGQCCTALDTAGCLDAPCESLVCARDAFCCEEAWDGLCVEMACEEDACACPPEVCPVPGDPSIPGTGDCCTQGSEPGCGDAACQTCVCDADPLCCADAWFATCAAIAANVCEDVCGCAGGGPVGADFEIVEIDGALEVVAGEPYRSLSVVFEGGPVFPVMMTIVQTSPPGGDVLPAMEFVTAPSNNTLVYPDVLGCAETAETQAIAYEITLEDAGGRATASVEYTFDCLSGGEPDDPTGSDPDAPVPGSDDGAGGGSTAPRGLCGLGMLTPATFVLACLLTARFIRPRRYRRRP